MTDAASRTYAPGDHHRYIVACYYRLLIDRFGLAATIRAITRFKRVVWTAQGYDMVFQRVSIAWEAIS